MRVADVIYWDVIYWDVIYRDLLRMTDIRWGELVGVLLVAALLSLFYYGGLWLTVQRLFRSEAIQSQTASWLHPVLLVAVSFIVRTLLVIIGLYVVTEGEFLPLLLALVVFITVRTLLLHNMRPALS